MNKKQMVLLAVVVLSGIYLFFFTDWFATEGIQVTHAVRPPSLARRARPGIPYLGRPVSPVFFTLNRKVRLTELKVYVAAEVATNKYAHPVWHLVTNAKPNPKRPGLLMTKGFVYGGFIRGMTSKVPNAEAEPLEPNVTYRLVFQTKDAKVDYDFKVPPVSLARR